MTAIRPRAIGGGWAQNQARATSPTAITPSGIAQRGSRGISSSTMMRGPSSSRPIYIVCGGRTRLEDAVAPVRVASRSRVRCLRRLGQPFDLGEGVLGRVTDVDLPLAVQMAAAEQPVDPRLRQVGHVPFPVLADCTGRLQNGEESGKVADVEGRRALDDLGRPLEAVPAEVIRRVD